MINPLIMLIGTGGFLLILLVHVLVWRTHRPSRQMLWLFTAFIILPDLCYIMLSLLARQIMGIPDGCFLYSLSNLFFILIWHNTLSAAYIMTYPPIQTGCPSLNIVTAVYSAMPRGLTSEEINRLFSGEALLSERIEEMMGDRLIGLKNGAWGLTFTGRFIRTGFSVYRKLLKLPLGEG